LTLQILSFNVLLVQYLGENYEGKKDA